MTPLLYSLHSGNLYGTERMALATALGLRDEFETTFVAPEGPFHAEASRLGFRTIVFKTPLRFAADIRQFFANSPRTAAAGTRALPTLAAALWSRVYRRPCANIQVVHGGTEERLSYGRKRWLNRLGTKQVAVSNYVRERMLFHGADPAALSVIENFLTPERVDSSPRREPFQKSGIRKIVIVSRLDPIKRIDLLLDALDLTPALQNVQFEIYGTGEDEQLLRSRALARNPNVHFLGYHPDIPFRVSQSDLLLHLCPEEPFGLAILEAMAAHVPVLVPNSGGAGAIIDPGKTGFHFRANDAFDLAFQLQYLQYLPKETLTKTVEAATRSLRTRFSANCGIAHYRKLIHKCLA
ncbi:MAG: glycosyltransferase family 4 protein [Acidobacteria bacterium]|nr:glycosyltransferase family 4 protein [Acidobacteriota bacterium]